MHNPKKEHYETLLDRMSSSHKNHYYFESCWYAYTILEDRLRSALINTGGDTYRNNKPIRTLGAKLAEIKIRRGNNANLRGQFTIDLVKEIDQWKDDRNDLMHALADATKSIPQIDKEIFLLSEQSKKLVKKVADASRRVKKYANR